MAEIARPVRVEHTPRRGFDFYTLFGADGSEIVRRVGRDNLDDLAAALNEPAALRAQVARVRALAERLQGGWHGACHYGLDWREGEIVREVGRELLAAIDGEGGAS